MSAIITLKYEVGTGKRMAAASSKMTWAMLASFESLDLARDILWAELVILRREVQAKIYAKKNR